MIGISMASDCASRSSLLIIWKLLLPLSCIMMRRFWTLCPCWMALWSAKALSFPPDHEAMSFMLFFFFSFFVGLLGFSVWMVYPALLIRVVVKGYARKG